MQNPIIVCLLFIFAITSSYSQDLFEDEYTKQPVTLFLRGKVLGSALLEDAFYLNYSIGTEVLLFERHAIGVDYVFTRSRLEEESYNPDTDMSEDNDFSDFYKRQYLNIDYRYYFYLFDWDVNLYLNAFTKIGEQTKWYQYKSILSRTASYDYRSSFNEYGLAIGTHIPFGSDDKVGLDINLGAVKQYNFVHYGTEGFQNGGNVTDPVYNLKQEIWKPHMRLNLYFRVF